MRHIFIQALTLLAASGAAAQAPAGYYDSCEGLSGRALLSALCEVAGPHTTISYGDLWEAYQNTDTDTEGRILDMYSTKRWTYGKEQCGNYSAVGDCYNREHSFPKSWFNDKSPMVSDLYHVYPTDGKVNGQRSNYPFGECAGGQTLAGTGSVKALGRLGASTFSGYSGIVFEPDDEYKGDFARSYFYMAAAYNDRFSTFSSDMLAGNSYPGFSSWAMELLLKWHRQDPVSAKEVARNEAVALYQNNRNPFIDFPDLAEHIWGTRTAQGWSATAEVTDPTILKPVAGSTIELGRCRPGATLTLALTVRTAALTAPLSLEAAAPFSVSPASLSIADANAGAEVTLSFTAPAAPQTSQGTLTLTSGTLTATVTLTATAVEGCGLRVAGVTEDSFELEWVNAHGADADYEVYAALAGEDEPVDGLPELVAAADGRFVVSYLQPETAYEAWLVTPDGLTPRVAVTTAALQPSIAVENLPELLTATAGEPSAPVELEVSLINTTGDVTATVTDPFRLSATREEWSTEAVILPGQDRFWLRVEAAAPGVCTSILTLRDEAGTEWAETVTAQVLSATAEPIVETFEAAPHFTDYSTPSYAGIFSWSLKDVAVPTGTAHNGTAAARFGKTASSTLEMAEDIPGGVTAVDFYGARWSSSDGSATLQLEYSLDAGASWHAVSECVLEQDNYQLFHADLATSVPTRLRLRQSAGARCLVDDFVVTPAASASGAVVVTDPDDAWDAWASHGVLTIANGGRTELSVYALDGTLVLVTDAAARTVALAPGLYIVASDSRARRVLVR